MKDQMVLYMKINNQNYGIEVKNLSFSYENDGGYSGMALQNVNFTADFGECVGIIGANGAGKSTLFNMICGTFEQDGGSIILDGKDIIKWALKLSASAIILVHNHPSGDPMPSREDILVTQRIREGGSLLGIELLYHIIIGDNCYVSLAEQKLLKEK